MDRAEVLANTAINQAQAIQREIQGLKNLVAKLTQRVEALEGGQAVEAVGFPRHVPGTTGRGILYELSDGTQINAGKVKALAAEARLHGA